MPTPERITLRTILNELLLLANLTLYTLFAYVKVFDEKILPGTLKSIGAYFLSQVISGVVLLIVIGIAWLGLSF